MSCAKSLFIELGTEELPPKTLDELGASFLRGICEGLGKRGMAALLEEATVYVTPRRLAVHVPEVAAAQPEQSIERRGPAANAAFDAQGCPSQALLKFAQSCGVGVEQLEKLDTDKGCWFVYRTVKPGQPVAALLPEIVDEALKGLPILKPMRWADHDYAFVRPVHWLVMLHGSQIVEGKILGLNSGRQSRGHRFMHPEPVHLVDAGSYVDALRKAKVLADPIERRQRIRDEVARVAKEVGGIPRLNDALLDEIANLTEWPVAIACTFERAFLSIPPEALITTMEANQKFVPIFDAQGKLTEYFIGIANLKSEHPDEIRKGYERVIRPRFADAQFFWHEDLKTPLASYQEALQSVTYQQALGSLWDKSMRVAKIARVVAHRVGVDMDLVTRAASLAKCDLLTRMVGEFPELQGVMARYYAQYGGEVPEVADALDSIYQPRFAGDSIAADKVGQVLAVAERLDTLAGIFAISGKPSGNKDPFALRRAALGLARTLIEGGLDLDHQALFSVALEALPQTVWTADRKSDRDKTPTQDLNQRRAALASQLSQFVLERLRVYYAEKGYTTEQYEAVRAVNPNSLVDFDCRLRAVIEFGRQPQAASLASANKRVANILRKQQEEHGVQSIGEHVDPAYFEEEAERALAQALQDAKADTADAWERRDYAAVLARLAQLQGPVDAFFDHVLVNAKNPVVRANRLALLGRLKAQFIAIADIARL